MSDAEAEGCYFINEAASIEAGAWQRLQPFIETMDAERAAVEMWQATPSPLAWELWDLALEYHKRCDAFDEITCTGPRTRDGLLPADGRELAQINRNAHVVLRDISQRAEAAGFTRRDLCVAIAQVERIGIVR